MGESTKRRLLPPSLRDIAQEAPLEAVLALVRAFGGRQIEIPRTPSPECQLSATIGVSHAAAIVRARGYGTYTVPKCTRLLKRMRDELILQRYSELKSANIVASEFGLHLVTIRRVIRAERKRLSAARRVKVRAARAGA